jgi:hypothetical protein
MKPITGLILNRAKAGMTSPAAPRMTSASLNPWLSSPNAMMTPWSLGAGLSADV